MSGIMSSFLIDTPIVGILSSDMENPSAGRVWLAGIDVLKDLDLLRTDVFPGGADVTVPDRLLRGLRTLYQKMDVSVDGRVRLCTWTRRNLQMEWERIRRNQISDPKTRK